MNHNRLMELFKLIEEDGELVLYSNVSGDVVCIYDLTDREQAEKDLKELSGNAEKMANEKND